MTDQTTAEALRTIAAAKRRIDLALRRIDADLVSDALIIALHRENFATRNREDARHSETTAAAYAILGALDDADRESAVAALAMIIHDRTVPRMVDPYCAPPRYPVQINADDAAEQAARRGIAHAGDLDD